MSPEVNVPDRDKLIEDVITRFGVRRIHVARLGSPVDPEPWKAKAPAGVEVHHWSYLEGKEWNHVFAWKLTPEEVSNMLADSEPFRSADNETECDLEQ